MKLTIALLLAFAIGINVHAQRRQKQITLAVMNIQSAYPFGKFAGMFTEQFHPGIEGGIGLTWKTKPSHDWFQEFKAGYFFHRFVQHGIPVYTDFGYRYKLSKRFTSDAIIGAGYLHSIPATDKFKLNKNGEYENNKGVGRMQAMVTFGLGASFMMKASSPKPLTIFSRYEQQIQMPFVKSYVPLLPYNSFKIGIRWPLKSK